MRRREPLSTKDHYDEFLAPVYDWVQGGWDQQSSANAALLRDLCSSRGLNPETRQLTAVDLGAGTGYQSVPLSQMGFDVLAVDSSRAMLSQLRHRLTDTSATTVRIVVGDMLGFANYLEGPADLVVCLTDTISHLANLDEVSLLIRQISDNLSPEGVVLLSFRDLTRLPSGDARFLAVRSDSERTLTCFLEEIDEQHVRVHDLLHTRNVETGVMEQAVSSYVKVRIPEAWLMERLEAGGLSGVNRNETLGLITVTACAQR